MKRPLLVLAFVVGTIAIADVPKGYYRFPAIHGDTVVFTAEGVAQRLTTHPGIEARAELPG